MPVDRELRDTRYWLIVLALCFVTASISAAYKFYKLEQALGSNINAVRLEMQTIRDTINYDIEALQRRNDLESKYNY